MVQLIYYILKFLRRAILCIIFLMCSQKIFDIAPSFVANCKIETGKPVRDDFYQVIPLLLEVTLVYRNVKAI